MLVSRGFRSLARWLAALVLGLGLMLPLVPGRAEDFDVDLALVLAIDCSFSVDAREFALQMEGLGRAFLREEVKRAIAQGHRQRIAVSVIQWSDDMNQKAVLPWTIISGAADADELGKILFNMRRQLAEGGTSISTALLYCELLFTSAPTATRRVVDISSDGRNNIGPPVAPVRDRLVANGITINALTILNEWPTLHIYFQDHVVGGEGHFVLTAENYADYEEAMLLKLVREITGPGIS